MLKTLGVDIQEFACKYVTCLSLKNDKEEDVFHVTFRDKENVLCALAIDSSIALSLYKQLEPELLRLRMINE